MLLDFDEALGNFEVLYKKGLATSTVSQLSNFRDVLEGDATIQTALSKIKGGVVVKPPKLVVNATHRSERSEPE